MSIPTPRQYQSDMKHGIYEAWNGGHRNVLGVLATGGGKTVMFSDIIKEMNRPTVAIAHRQELVAQISVSLARFEVYHNIIAPPKIVKFIASRHSVLLGRSFFHPNAPTAVAGVDTLLRRDLGSWPSQVQLTVQDEAHHIIRGNKWGKAAELFPNALGLGVTATPLRADGKGLGAHSDGLFHSMIEGPSMRELINMGMLTDYRIYCPESDIDLSTVDVSGATGDFNANQLRSAAHKSHIVGDVVEQYIKIASGMQGVTFAVDVETATKIAAKFRDMGVPAEVVSAKTPDHLRTAIVDRFERRELMQLVNVDLFGEGFDLPAIEVVSMARPTASYGLYVQQFGRALRIKDGKEIAIIIDHVGNVVRHHGPPDVPRTWSLDARERGSRAKRDEDTIPLTACTSCMQPYERVLSACPFCGEKPIPAERSTPEQVDGDLFEMSLEALQKLRGETIVESPEDLKKRMTFAGAPDVVLNSALKNRNKLITARETITEVINNWGAIVMMSGVPQAEAYKQFFFKFKIDVIGAQTLGCKETEALTERILNDV